MAKKVFYSFCYDDDVFRVQQIRNIGAIENETILTANQWEEVKRKGSTAIENWISTNMNYKDCVIVLIGENTASRDWVKYEINLAKQKGKAMFGIYIHNLKSIDGKKSRQGKNPFDEVFGYGKHSYKCYNPQDIDIDGLRAYNNISSNIETWFNTTVATSKWF